MGRLSRVRLRQVGRLAVLYLLAGTLALICLVPLAWIVKTSFETTEFLRSSHIQFWPIKPTLQNYRDVLGNPNAMIARSMFNSFFVGSIATAVNLAITTLAGYAMSRFEFRGKLMVGMYLLIFYMIPRTLLLIGMFVMLSKLHLLNNLIGLMILYAATGIPLATWWLKGYFDAIPIELEEQAMLDGCSRIGALWRVLLPLAAPGLAAVAIFQFVDAWNEYMMALTVISAPQLRLLPVQIVNFMGIGQVEWGQVMAFSIIAATPAVILFALAQRQMVRGLMSGFGH